MTPEDRRIIQKWDHGQHNLKITLATAQNDLGDQMAQFCDELQGQLHALKVKKEGAETGFSSPAMIVGHYNNIAYQAVPSNKLLKTLLSTLKYAADNPPEVDDGLNAQLQQIDLPVALKLYISPHCPHCPGTLDQLLPLAATNRHLRLTIIDAQQFNHAAETDQIRSVPTLILEDQFRWSGPMQMKEILTICIQRDPAQLSTASVRQLIEDGQAQRVSRMMVESNAIFPALVELLVHERWSVRLGAMVTAEYLADEAGPLALELAIQLWHRFPHLSDPIKGDVLQVIGQANCEKTRGYLNSILSGPFDNTLKEAAADALDDMQSR